MGIAIKNISKEFGSFKAVDDISLDIPTGKLVALLGPSGSGKTSLLRIVAGLEEADQGVVYFDDEEVTNASAKERNIGFVFQHYALFRHMTVFDNIAFGLRARPRKTRPSKDEIRNRVEELLALVKLEAFADHYPMQLSGGQRQRVALARAILIEPRVLLLDEPFGALDAKVRKELRKWLRNLHRNLDVTSVFVTHDQEEALEVADLVVIMNKGRIEQIGTPREVYDNPASPFVYEFLGNVNRISGKVEDGVLKDGFLQFDAPAHIPHDQEVVGYVRPHHIAIEREANWPDMIMVEVTHIQPFGSTVQIEVLRKDNGKYLEAEVSREQYEELDLMLKDHVFIRPNQFQIFIPDDYII
ncbi:sulfate ABC transporter ATP-binding protein [Aciduricibacillus chroicocephali]|uniref:Sulfate ABC transporter ATP-binding protein n=1 Tax=Aciduricibacillus chroicocephali TaxID=3054939 RepID=A0ABY9KVP5_9BACI|nr:sulfate ABC transporter ATP-binding protein [Bacillaceae bacterium 44XB]